MLLTKLNMITYNTEECQNQNGKASFHHMLDIGDEQYHVCNQTHQLQ